MSRGLKQTVTISINLAGAIMNCIETTVLIGVTHKNIRSKVREEIDSILVQHNTMAGGRIVVDIGPAEEDEFARPDRE